MAESRPRQTVEDYPGLFYHQVSAPDILAIMDAVRSRYIALATFLLESCPQDRYRSLAMTALEESLRCAIGGLAVSDTAAKRAPVAHPGA